MVSGNFAIDNHFLKKATLKLSTVLQAKQLTYGHITTFTFFDSSK